MPRIHACIGVKMSTETTLYGLLSLLVLVATMASLRALIRRGRGASSRRPPLRVPLADWLLIAFVIASVWQYQAKGQVSWVTDTLRGAEMVWLRLSAQADSAADQAMSKVEMPDIAVPDVALPKLNLPDVKLPESLRTIGGSQEAPAAVPAVAGYDLYGEVVKVTDGDTLLLRDAQQSGRRIRIYGIDTPERDQPYGPEASRALKRALEGQWVAVTSKEIDHYGRTVGVVYVDGVDIGLQLVCDGHAWWYRRYARDEQKLADCEASARKKRLGLWAQGDAVEPWVWRRRNK